MKYKIFLLVIIPILVLGASAHFEESGLQLLIDGPDADNKYTSAEAIHFGRIDCWGSLSEGGDFMGIRGMPLGAQNIDDMKCKGVIYELFPATGGNTEFSHPNSALALKITSPSRWQLSVTSQVNGHPSVSVEQLSFKEDTYREYIPFTNHPQTIVNNGQPGIYNLFYDLALKIEFDDKPGNYSWIITYTLSSY